MLSFIFERILDWIFGAQLILLDFTPVDSYQYKLDNFGSGGTEKGQFTSKART